MGCVSNRLAVDIFVKTSINICYVGGISSFRTKNHNEKTEICLHQRVKAQIKKTK